MVGYKGWCATLHFVLLLLIPKVSTGAPIVDKIFINANIYTLSHKAPTAQAIAVGNGKIVAIGSNADVLKYKTPATNIISLDGKRVMPGLIDAHSHAIFAGLAALSPNLNDAEITDSELLKQLEVWRHNGIYSANVPMVVFGVNPATWSDPDMLGSMFNSNSWVHQPLLLMGSDYHTAWANQAMRSLAGLNIDFVQSLPPWLADTVGVNSNGELNGVLVDAGLDKVTLVLPKPSQEILFAAGQAAVKIKNQYGITAWIDPAANAGPGEALFSRTAGSIGEGILPAYKALAQANLLTAHVAALLVASPNSDAADLDKLQLVRNQYEQVPNLNLSGIKIFADGVLEYPAQSAALLGQYINSGKQGELLLTQQHLCELVDAIDQRGWFVHIHALGDRAVQESLNAIECARKNRNSGVLHSITHLQLVDYGDYSRFSQLGVVAVMQLHWAQVDNYLLDLVKPYITDSDFQRQYPAKSLHDRGTIIAGASDWPISTANPWEAIHHAITRGGLGDGLNPSERMDKESMLRAYTINAATAMQMDHLIGSLDVGKQADFIVLDRDVLTVSVEELKDTKVLATYFSGEKVYELEQ